MGGTQSMIGKDWYRHLAATNQRIVEARHRVDNKKSKQEGRATAALVVRLRSLEDALQDLTIRRERILQRARSQPLPVVDHCGAVVAPISHIHCTAIEGLPPDIVHLLHKSLVGIGLMRMSR
jgi:hypothetical protein